MRVRRLLTVTPAPPWWRTDMTLPAGFSYQNFSGRRLKLDHFPHTSREDAAHLQNVSSWICFEVDETEPHLFGALLDGIEGLQIVCPFRWSGHVFAVDKETFNLRQTTHHAAVFNLGWSKLVNFPQIPAHRPECCIGAYSKSRRQAVIRLINPPLLLMQGLQARNPMISLLLWTMGLDAILSTSDAMKFRGRLEKLLGKDTYFMPASEFFGQPDYEVGETAENIYTLRGIIAHGNEIPARFRDHVGFRVIGAAPPPDWETWSYSHVLSECALHLLCAAILRIYEDQTLFGLASGDASTWKRWLDN